MPIIEDVDPVKIIQSLMEVSETVTEYINTQSYLTDTDDIDSIDLSGVATQCYIILLDELRRKGVEFYNSPEELLECWLNAERIYHLYCWINTKYQIDFIKRHPILFDKLEQLLSTTDAENDIIVDWFNLQFPLEKDNLHLVAIEDILSEINTTEDFHDLLTYVLKQTRFVDSEFKVPLEHINEYIQAMHNNQILVLKGCEYLLNSEIFTTEEKEIVEKVMKRVPDTYDTDKLQPSVISDYTWAWKIEENKDDIIPLDDLPEELKLKYEELDHIHHTSANHHPEYYLAHPEVVIDIRAIVLLYTTCFQENQDKTFDKIAKLEKLLNDKLIPYQDNGLIDRIKKIFSKAYTDNGKDLDILNHTEGESA